MPKIKLLAAALFCSLGLSFAAAAETVMPKTWNEAISDVFFTDAAMMTPRSAEEMAGKWATMTPEHQAQVREDCKTWEASPKTGADSDRVGGEGLETVCKWVNSQS